MGRLSVFLLATAAAGLHGCCYCDDDDDSGWDPCPELVSVAPEPDSVEVETQRVVVRWSRRAEQISLVLLDASGEVVAGELSSSSGGTVLTFSPSAPFAPRATYVATASADCGDEITWSFTTSALGLPMDDPQSLVGATFALRPAAGDVAGEPDNALFSLMNGPLLMAVLPVADFDVGPIHLLTAASIDFAGPNQDLCLATAVVTAGPDAVVGTSDDLSAIWTDPELALTQASTATVQMNGEPALLSDIEMTLTFHPEASSFRAASFSATVDVRAVPPFSGGGAGGSLCAQIQEYWGAPCAVCGDGVAACVSVSATEVPGQRVDVAILERSESEIAADPNCQ